MRLLVTADLHYNHPRSRDLADKLIDEMNQVKADVLLLVGDTASADGSFLEECLDRFQFTAPKLFVAGNHELWTRTSNSLELFRTNLPGRVRSLGWHWLQDEPFIFREHAIVGSIGWYDYAFALAELAIPFRFYERKISPAAAAQLSEFAALLPIEDDLPERSRELFARWNDGRFVSLGMSDGEFLAQLLSQLEEQLTALSSRRIVAAIHHLPFAQLLPPAGRPALDFARAYLGSPRIGELLSRFPSVRTVLCGHSHFPAEAQIGPMQAINIGSGYRRKLFRLLDLS
jgi:predicted phosphodiesterase